MKPLTYCRSHSDLTRCGTAEGWCGTVSGLRSAEGLHCGRYCSTIYDSGEAGTEWNRFAVGLVGSSELLLHIWIGDNPPPELAAFSDNWEWLCQNAVLTAREPDVLLHGCLGRWFRFGLEIGFPSAPVFLKHYEVSFPKLAFSGYLPRIYQGNPTLDRYLGILQTCYLETTAEIEGFPRQLTPSLADDSALRDLAQWVGTREWIQGLSRPVTEALVREAFWLHERRGTRLALSRFIELLTGETPVIIEPAQWNTLPKNTNERQAYTELYGEEWMLAVLLKKEPPIERQRLLRLMEDFIPIGVECRLLVLKERRPVGDHFYLGVNTWLPEPEKPVIGSERLRLGAIRLEGE